MEKKMTPVGQFDKKVLAAAARAFETLSGKPAAQASCRNVPKHLRSIDLHTLHRLLQSGRIDVLTVHFNIG
jgi:hypothetical protein